MTFRRTDQSFASTHLFYGVDYVAYCEGGESIPSIDKLDQKSGNSETADAAYWRKRLEHSCRGKQIKVLSVGSKILLRQLCQVIKDQNLTTVLVCMDSDYDHLCACKETGSFVYYTWGYSWENDVYCAPVLERVVRIFVDDSDKCGKFLEAFGAVISSSTKYCEMDLVLVRLEKGGIFKRKGAGGNFVLGQRTAAWDEKAFQQRLAKQGYKSGPRRKVKINAGEVERWLVGKVLPHLAKGLMKIHFDAKRTFGSMSEETLSLLAVDKFGELLREANPHIASRY